MQLPRLEAEWLQRCATRGMGSCGMADTCRMQDQSLCLVGVVRQAAKRELRLACGQAQRDVYDSQ